MSTPINDGGPAFPREDYQTADAGGQEGMTLRDYFAGQALMGLIASTRYTSPTHKTYAECAFCHADAMLKAREVAP